MEFREGAPIYEQVTYRSCFTEKTPVRMYYEINKAIRDNEQYGRASVTCEDHLRIVKYHLAQFLALEGHCFETEVTGLVTWQNFGVISSSVRTEYRFRQDECPEAKIKALRAPLDLYGYELSDLDMLQIARLALEMVK